MSERFKKAAVLENQFEAQMLEHILQDLEIPHLIRSYHDEVYGGLFQMVKGWGDVQAPEQYKSAIEEMLEELRSSAESEFNEVEDKE